MGYRVGGQCFSSVQEASDYKMSMVVPAITADGSLKMPIRKNDGWYYGTSKIQITHPYCDPIAAFKDGMEIGNLIASFFAIVAIVKAIKSILQKYDVKDVAD